MIFLKRNLIVTGWQPAFQTSLALSCSMLFLQSLQLIQFKNYSHQTFRFSGPVTAITGANGIGKTNVLDAIHYLSFTKSYFQSGDGLNVQHGTQGFRIDGEFTLSEESLPVSIVLRETGKKEVSCNGSPYEKFSHHIGRFPCVMIAPDDVELIIGGSEMRRSFLDTVLSQMDAVYLQQLISYNKVLQQRNSFLKSCAQTQTRNDALLDVFEDQLLAAGNYIFTKRNEFLPGFNQQVLHFYASIAGKAEPVAVTYESKLLEQPFDVLLQQSREKDHLLQRTTTGIHRDDLYFSMNNEPFKQTASQGQRKSLLFSLKLAEAEVLKQQKGFAPLLLLDDVFEKLDAERMHNLLHYVCTQFGGQVFLTDTHPQRMKTAFADMQIPLQLIELD